MKNRYFFAALGVFTAQTGFAAVSAQQCQALLDSNLYQTQITAAEWDTSGVLPADRRAALTGGAKQESQIGNHCVVSGKIAERVGVNGKPYAIQFQLRLPQDWNGKFLYQGGGGMDGFVAPAVGSIPSRGSSARNALQRGYAVVSTDSGHDKPTPEFAEDQQARLDYAYAAIGKVTQSAKQLINQFYAKPIDQSLFMGCSNGGRAAMMAAQRYPTEFDGIIAGNPGFRLSRAAVAEAWDTQHFMRAAPADAQGRKVLANAFTPQDLELVSNAVLQQCDAKDGLADGFIHAWQQCDFKPQSLQCPAGADKSAFCLSETQVSVLDAVFGGAKNSRGEALYSSWPYDSGISEDGWRAWKLGDSQDAEQPNARNVVLGTGSLKYYFMTPQSPDTTLLNFDFDRDVAKTAETAAINDAVATDFGTFQARGGKMIIFHGVSDPVFSADDLAAWFESLQRHNPQTEQFARLFMIPGMNHCGGGKALEDIDPLSAIEAWLDQAQAPDSLLAKGSQYPGISRPICAYPKVATYQSGDTNAAASFICR